MIIGSFCIEEKSVGVAKVFTVSYAPKHKRTNYWQFIDDESTAIEFAKKKTSEDSKFHKQNA